MHKSVMDFVRESVAIIKPAGYRVVEIGSRNVNGSAREVLQGDGAPELLLYNGVDIESGPGVDTVWDCTQFNLPPICCEVDEAKAFWDWCDLVVCCEVLEHVQKWDWMISAIKRMVTKPGSWVILTTRSPGFPRHEFPGDFWRFKLSDLMIAFADFEIIRLEPDPQVSGVFLLARRPLIRLADVHPEPAPTEPPEVKK
jgi:hypothetical protein